MLAVAVMVLAIAGAGYVVYNSSQKQYSVQPVVINQPANSGASLNSQGNSGSCTVALPAGQTPAYTVTDADLNTGLSPTTTLYTNAASGTIYTNANTVPGTAYSVLFNQTGYLSDLETFTTPCNTVTPTVFGKMKKLDTSVTTKVFNSDLRTANSISANQSIGQGGSATIEFDVTPSGQSRHIGGGGNGQTPTFAVFFNATNTTNWDMTKWNVAEDAGTWSANGGFAGSCQSYNGPAPASLGGVYVAGSQCTGDFSGNDTQLRKLYVTIGGSSLYGGTQGTLCIVPYDIYKNSVANKYGAANTPLVGAVRNDGTQLDAPQCQTVYVN